MAKPQVSGHNTTSDNLQTLILRVYIHCEGCKKKVFKVLQSIDGVYKTVIDAKEHKVTVTGSVNGETLVQKLLKSGKHAEILPESFSVKAAADNASGNSKKKKKESNKQNDVVTTVEDAEHVKDEKNESKSAIADGIDGGNVQEKADPAVAGGGGDGDGKSNESGGKKKKKNKKNKGGKNDNNAPVNGETEGLPPGNPSAAAGVPAEKSTASMEPINLGPPIPQMVYSTPYDLPPYHSYYPTPAYGVSYSTSYPSTESSYYTPPVYGYAQSHPSVFDPVQASTLSYRGSAFDDHDDEGGEGRWCAIM